MSFKYTIRKDGRLMKRVSVNGQIKTIYSDNPKDLEKQYIELKHLSNKGMIAEDNGLNIEQWANKWFDTYKADKEQATKNMYSDAIKLYIVPELGNIKLKNIKENDITSMLNKLNDKPRQKEIVLLTIKQILDKAVDNDYIYKNVANKVKIKKHKSVEKIPLTELDIDYLKKAVKIDPRCYMVLFMLYTGIRREEVAPLLYKDIDIENKTVTINKAVHWNKNKPTIKSTKNEDVRKIPILDVIFDTINEMKQSHKDNDIVFPKATENVVMSETSIRRLLEHTLVEINKLYKKDQLDTLENEKSVSNEENKKIEIKNIKFTYHQLRHTYACFLHKANIPAKEAQYLTGHKNVNVLLNIYTHLDNEDKQNATNKLNNLLKA